MHSHPEEIPRKKSKAHHQPWLYQYYYPTSPLRQHHIRIPLPAYLPQHFFPPLYHHFYIFMKRWSLTSNVTPTSTTYSDSPPRVTYPNIFPPLYLHFNFSWSGGALPPTSPLRQHQIRIRLLALPPRIFSRLSTTIYNIFIKGFTHALSPWRNT